MQPLHSLSRRIFNGNDGYADIPSPAPDNGLNYRSAGRRHSYAETTHSEFHDDDDAGYDSPISSSASLEYDRRDKDGGKISNMSKIRLGWQKSRESGVARR